jgi:hypothetical protein
LKAFDRPVNPSFAEFATGLPYPKPRLAVVQASQYEVEVSDVADAEPLNSASVALKRYVRIQFARSACKDFGFEFALVAVAKEHPASEVRVLDPVHVNHFDATHTK